MATVSGLPETDGRAMQASVVRSWSNVWPNLKNTQPVIAAGATGSITVWLDKNGRIRSEFSRRCSPVDSGSFATKKALNEWLKEWFPQLGIE